jgi:hypothetical protein
LASSAENAANLAGRAIGATARGAAGVAKWAGGELLGSALPGLPGLTGSMRAAMSPSSSGGPSMGPGVSENIRAGRSSTDTLSTQRLEHLRVQVSRLVDAERDVGTKLMARLGLLNDIRDAIPTIGAGAQGAQNKNAALGTAKSAATDARRTHRRRRRGRAGPGQRRSSGTETPYRFAGAGPGSSPSGSHLDSTDGHLWDSGPWWHQVRWSDARWHLNSHWDPLAGSCDIGVREGILVGTGRQSLETHSARGRRAASISNAIVIVCYVCGRVGKGAGAMAQHVRKCERRRDAPVRPRGKSEKQLAGILRAASVAHSMRVECPTCEKVTKGAGPGARHARACRRRSEMPPRPPARTTCEVCGAKVWTKRIVRHRQECEARARRRVERLAARERAPARVARVKKDPRLLSEERRARMVLLNTSLTPEERRARSAKGAWSRVEWMRRYNASLTPEQRSARSAKGARSANARMTAEERSSRQRAAAMKMSPEARSERARRATAHMTPEQRRERSRISWATRRANAVIDA